jgi:predicted dehydrogenase
MYMPALRETRELARIAALCDIDEERARAAASQCTDWSAEAVVYTDREAFLAHPELDGVLQLLPAPLHGEANAEILEAGIALYSEKPIAASPADGTRLIDLAARRGTRFLCAPGVMASPAVRWIDEILRSGRLGTPTVAVGAYANLGAAAWRRYTGDPSVFYSDSVGPLLDVGVYLVHALTGLLGAVRRVQAMGGITMPERVSVTRSRPGLRIAVSTPDVVLAQLEFAQGGFAQLLAAYAAPASTMPQLEIHLSQGTISLGSLVVGESVDVYLVDPSPVGLEGWVRGLAPPGVIPGMNVVGHGARHFVRVLAGLDEPVLTAEHARHALDVMQTILEALSVGESLAVTSSLTDPPSGRGCEAVRRSG